MKLYNIFQGIIGQSYFALPEEDVTILAKLFINGGGNVRIGGKVMYVHGEIFEIYVLDEKFGNDSDRIEQFYITRKNAIYRGRFVQELFREGGKNVTKEFFKKLEESIPEVISKVDNLNSNNFDLFEIIHPEIKKVSIGLFESKHYKESVQAAIVEVVDTVKRIYKEKTGNCTMDGKPLMMNAFAEDNPIIKLVGDTVNDAKGIQEGYKLIFAGMVLAIRNPKAHANFEIDRTEAIEMLFMCSRLMRKLDERVI